MPGFEVIGEEERAAVLEVFDDGGALCRSGVAGMRRNGRYRVKEFEEAFADYLGSRYALAVASGTAALKVALMAIGVGPGDEVITQAFTFVATVEAIVDIGAIPVVVNVDDTLNMDPEELAAAITPRTRAILPVHMLGVAASMEAIMPVAVRHGLPVLEDNCEALGSSWGGRMLGTQGTACAFSFDVGKVITTGEGGMVTTDEEEVYNLAREYHDHGHEDNPNLPRGMDSRRIPGFNFRMTELQAAVGMAQLEKLDRIIEANRRNYALLEDGLAGLESRGLAWRRVPPGCKPACDALIFQLPTEAHARAFAKHMADRGLGTKNLPDAMDWHFAGTWEHIFSRYGTTKGELWERMLPTYSRLSRCIAVPVMVKDTPERVLHVAATLRAIADEVL